MYFFYKNIFTLLMLCLNVIVPLQCSVRHSDTAECRHQEAIEAIPECYTRETRLPRVQVDETRQP